MHRPQAACGAAGQQAQRRAHLNRHVLQPAVHITHLLQTNEGTVNRSRAGGKGCRWRVPGRLANTPPHAYSSMAAAQQRPGAPVRCGGAGVPPPPPPRSSAQMRPGPATHIQIQQLSSRIGAVGRWQHREVRQLLAPSAAANQAQATGSISAPLQPSPCAPGEARAPLQSKTCGAESKGCQHAVDRSMQGSCRISPIVPAVQAVRTARDSISTWERERHTSLSPSPALDVLDRLRQPRLQAGTAPVRHALPLPCVVGRDVQRFRAEGVSAARVGGAREGGNQRWVSGATCCETRCPALQGGEGIAAAWVCRGRRQGVSSAVWPRQRHPATRSQEYLTVPHSHSLASMPPRTLSALPRMCSSNAASLMRLLAPATAAAPPLIWLLAPATTAAPPYFVSPAAPQTPTCAAAGRQLWQRVARAAC